jgi:hypothetical protein
MSFFLASEEQAMGIKPFTTDIKAFSHLFTGYGYCVMAENCRFHQNGWFAVILQLLSQW